MGKVLKYIIKYLLQKKSNLKTEEMLRCMNYGIMELWNKVCVELGEAFNRINR